MEFAKFFAAGPNNKLANRYKVGLSLPLLEVGCTQPHSQARLLSVEERAWERGPGRACNKNLLQSFYE